MEETRYLDFDLSIEKTGTGNYRARVLASPAGVARADFSLPFSPIELENFILKVGRTRRGVRRLESPEMEAAKDFGGRLFKSVFSDEVQSVLRGSLDQTRQQGMGLRLRLRLNDAPELVNLPWEYLYNPNLNRFLSLSVNTPLVRYLELPEQIKPLAVEPPLRALVMIASPQDYPPLDVEHEWNNLKQALSGLESRGALVVDRLEGATPLALQYALRRQDYHIFHFIGHGGFDERAQDGVLLLEDEAGRGRALSGQYLGALLHDEETLRLVVLNACEGARTGKDDPFAGAAQSLVQQGLPAVIAMQFEVTDQAAVTFSREFYSAVADGYPVDAALVEARKGIFATGNDVEWGTPVLYMRLPDGKVFDLVRKARSLPRPAEQGGIDEKPPAGRDVEKGDGLQMERRQLAIDAYESGLGAFYIQDWERAARFFRQAVKYRLDYPEAVSKLKEAERQLEAQARLTEAQKWAEAGEWAKVVALLEPLDGMPDLPPNAKAALGKPLNQARGKVRLAELYADARSLQANGQWQAVVNVFEEISALDPNYPDPEGLLAGAKTEIAAQQRQASLKADYSQALGLIEAGRWADAHSLLSKIQAEAPGYRDTESLLQRAEAEIKQAELDRQANELFAAAERAFKTGDYPRATDQLRQLQQAAPSYPGAAELAARVTQAQEALQQAGPLGEGRTPGSVNRTLDRPDLPKNWLNPRNRKMVTCGLAAIGLLAVAGLVLVLGINGIINRGQGGLRGNVPQAPAATSTPAHTPTWTPSPTAAPSLTPIVDLQKTMTAAADATRRVSTQRAVQTHLAIQTAAPKATGLARVKAFRTSWKSVVEETFKADSNLFFLGSSTSDFGTSDKKVVAGKLIWKFKSLKGVVYRDSSSTYNFSDFLVSVEARKVYSCSGAYGLVFRDQGDGYYKATIDNYMFSVSIRENDTWDELLHTNLAASVNLLDVNKITVLGQGTRFTFLVNDLWVAELNDNQLIKGEAGIVIEVNGANGDCTFEFDNFEVLQP